MKYDFDSYPFPFLPTEEYVEIRKDRDAARRIDAAKQRADDLVQGWADQHGVKAMLLNDDVAIKFPEEPKVIRVAYTTFIRLTSRPLLRIL